MRLSQAPFTLLVPRVPPLSPCSQSRGCCRGDTSAASPQTDLSLCPGSRLPRKPPNFLSSGDWLQGLLPSQEYHRAGLIKPPIVSQGPASSLLSGAGIPFQEQDSGRKCGGVLISQPPKQSPLGQSAAGGMRTVHLLALPLWPPPAQATAHAGLPGPARWRPWKLSSPSWQGRGVLGLCPLGSGLPLP